MLARDQRALDLRVRSLRAGVASFAALRRAAASLAVQIRDVQDAVDLVVPADGHDRGTLTLLRSALAAHLAYVRSLGDFPTRPRSLAKTQASAAIAGADRAQLAYTRLEGANPGLPSVMAPADRSRLLAVVRPPSPPQSRSLAPFVDRIESLLNRSATGRAELVSALGQALNCSIVPDEAATRVASVVNNRQTLLGQLGSVQRPTPQAARAVSLLRAAWSHSIAADRHYDDWLRTLPANSTCPLPQTNDFSLARAEDARASAAKRDFIAAFNPLATETRRQTWSEGQI